MINIFLQSSLKNQILDILINDFDELNIAVNICEVYEENIIYDLKIINDIKYINHFQSEIVFFIIKNETDIYDYQKYNIDYYVRYQNLQIDLKDGLKKYANKLKYKDDMIILKSQLITYRIRKDNIIYIESMRNYIYIYTRKRTLKLRKSLKEIIKLLDDRFVQIHKSYIVNMDKIDNISQKDINMIEKINLPLGNKYKDRFMMIYNEYIQIIEC